MSEYVGEIIGLSLAVGLGSVAFIYIAIWNSRELERMEKIPQPITAAKPLPTPKIPSRNDVLAYNAEKKAQAQAQAQSFARKLTFDEIPLNRRMTIETSWGLSEQDVVVRKKELQDLGGLTTVLTVESANKPMLGLRVLSPLLTDPQTRIVRNTTFSLSLK